METSGFRKGDRIPIGQDFAEISEYLGNGAQGTVYMVKYRGDNYALKWYNHDAVPTADALAFRRDNLQKLAERPSPDPAFVWPIAVTDVYRDSFGYIMPLIPESYEKLCNFLNLDSLNFSSFRGIVSSCLKFVSAFRNLGYAGLSYMDINDGNFFIDPDTDNVLICDNDNIAPINTDMGILGNPKYAAPEVVLGQNLPNTLSDRHSLAIIIFQMLFSAHPLEGERWIGNYASKENTDLVYVTDPVFIFDPANGCNRPVKGMQNEAIDRWALMPDYMRKLFCKAFSHLALKEDPNQRPTENDWLSALSRFSCSIALCDCGNEVFLKDSFSAECDSPDCDNAVSVKYGLRLPAYVAPATAGAVISRCQLGTCDVGRELDPLLLIVTKADDPSAAGAKNVSSDHITVITPNKTEKSVAFGAAFPLMEGMRIMLCGTEVTVVSSGTSQR